MRISGPCYLHSPAELPRTPTFHDLQRIGGEGRAVGGDAALHHAGRQDSVLRLLCSPPPARPGPHGLSKSSKCPSNQCAALPSPLPTHCSRPLKPILTPRRGVPPGPHPNEPGPLGTRVMRKSGSLDNSRSQPIEAHFRIARTRTRSILCARC